MIERLGPLMEVSLTMGAVIALLLLLSPLLARRFTPRWRYWAWLFVALRLVIPFNFTLPQGAVRVEAPAALTAPAYDPQMTAELQQARPYGYMLSSVCVWDNTAHFQVWYHDDQGNIFRIFDNPLFRLESINGAWSLTLHWEGLWAAGCGVSLLWLARSYAALCRRVRRWARPAGAEAREALERQRERLGVNRRVRLLELPGLASPMLMGFLRPAILLPEGLAEDVLPATLAHELTHFQRRDLWYKLLLALARAVHWFNPLVWLMCRRGGEDVELCCDYDLLRAQDEAARRAYGQAILDQMTAGSGSAARLTTGFSGNKKEVFRRFRAIMDTTAKKKGRAALTLALAVVLLAGGLVACDWADSAAPDLTAADLDFTGYTGTVYAWGGEDTIAFSGDGSALTLDPCGDQGLDGDHTLYTLPLAQNLDYQETDLYRIRNKFGFGARLGTRQPDYYRLELTGGAISAIQAGTWGSWPLAEGDQALYGQLRPLFEAFQQEDYEAIAQFCVPDSLLVKDDSAFWFRHLRPLAAEALPGAGAPDDPVTLELLVDGEPAPGSALERTPGPYILWLTLLPEEDGQLRIDYAATGSAMIP